MEKGQGARAEAVRSRARRFLRRVQRAAVGGRHQEILCPGRPLFAGVVGHVFGPGLGGLGGKGTAGDAG